jgi:hypothetical protein
MENQNNQNSNERELFDPLIMSPINPEIRALSAQKTFEQRLYLVLYYRKDENDETVSEFAPYVGRYACYTGIAELLNLYNIDIHNSLILVEIPVINKSNKAEWVLKDPENAPSIYQFCKSVEVMFPALDFSIDDYNIAQPVEEEDDSPNPVTVESMVNKMNNAAASIDEVEKAYKELLKEQNS